MISAGADAPGNQRLRHFSLLQRIKSVIDRRPTVSTHLEGVHDTVLLHAAHLAQQHDHLHSAIDGVLGGAARVQWLQPPFPTALTWDPSGIEARDQCTSIPGIDLLRWQFPQRRRQCSPR